MCPASLRRVMSAPALKFFLALKPEFSRICARRKDNAQRLIVPLGRMQALYFLLKLHVKHLRNRKLRRLSTIPVWRWQAERN